MNIFSLLTRRTNTAVVAKDRLKILLAHERVSTGSNAELVNKLREDILAVVRKHLEIDPEAVKVEMDRNGDMTMLGIDIELPVDNKPAAEDEGKSASKAAGA
ncbi:cell division topological specificity factor MinE [Stappia sp. F7233]|uniref:Cell division topological specificity factor n=1 Tax=Stappia albiluteola TaxID=2758565 RepID=A0A839AH19_9HYPH|nr:cell division topological specificity factor MinE [Stappia albiluteola]MBA5778202.1 cell division topological specificity factor MinE [Stappia albiluteola]